MTAPESDSSNRKHGGLRTRSVPGVSSSEPPYAIIVPI